MIEIGYFLNDVYNSTYSSNLGVLFSNILYTSLLVSIIILIIICCTYPCKRGTPIYVTFKLVFYVFIFVLGILAIHQGVMEKKFEEKYSNKMNKDLLEAVKGGSINTLFGSGKKVKINPLFVNREQNPNTDEDTLNDDKCGTSNNLGGDDTSNNTIKVSATSVEDMLADLGA